VEIFIQKLKEPSFCLIQILLIKSTILDNTKVRQKLFIYSIFQLFSLHGLPSVAEFLVCIAKTNQKFSTGPALT
jgi:hypothetical protein